MSLEKIQISNDSLVSAHSLRHNNMQKRNLKEIITNIIKQISQELSAAHREGNHNIITSIPTIFNIPNMSNADGQRYIYSAVITELLKKDYRIQIATESDSCRLKITWMSPEDELDVQMQLNLIAKHTVKKI